MKEFVKINGTQYECINVTTGINTISFTMVNENIMNVKETVENATELFVTDTKDGIPYGIYSNLTFFSISGNADEEITVIMHIASNIEKRLAAIETSQSEQDEAILDLANVVSSVAEATNIE